MDIPNIMRKNIGILFFFKSNKNRIFKINIYNINFFKLYLNIFIKFIFLKIYSKFIRFPRNQDITLALMEKYF